jgi:hypothetical protein
MTPRGLIYRDSRLGDACYHTIRDCARGVGGAGVYIQASPSVVKMLGLLPCPDCADNDGPTPEEVERLRRYVMQWRAPDHVVEGGLIRWRRSPSPP